MDNKEESIQTFCAICGEPVTKTIVTTRDIESDCSNEYGAHKGSNYYKYKYPKAAWETKENVFIDTLSSSESSATEDLNTGRT